MGQGEVLLIGWAPPEARPVATARLMLRISRLLFGHRVVTGWKLTGGFGCQWQPRPSTVKQRRFPSYMVCSYEIVGVLEKGSRHPFKVT